LEVKIIMDDKYTTPSIVIYTNQMTPEIQALVNNLRIDHTKQVLGYNGGEVFIIEPTAISRIHTEGNKVIAVCEEGSYQLKNRIYEIDENPPTRYFIRISNSEIVNFEKVKSLDLSITGTITLKFKNGQKTYVSRRYVDKIKTHLGI